MIANLLSVAGLAHSITSGIRLGKQVELLLKQQANTHATLTRLSDHIFYATTLHSVRDTTQSKQLIVQELRKVRQALEPVQCALNVPIISGAAIRTPRIMKEALERNPWQVLMDIKPVKLAEKSPNPELVPILFEHKGVQYIGWQMRGTLPILFNCEYDREKNLRESKASSRKKVPEAELYRIMNKVAATGFESLTEEERRVHANDLQDYFAERRRNKAS